MKLIRLYIQVVDKIMDSVGFIVSWITTLLVLVVSYDVCTRYLFNKSSIAVQELEWHLFALIFLLGAATTLKNDKHVRVDIFYAKMSKKFQAWINLLGSLICLLPFSFLVVWASLGFVENSFAIREISPNPGGLQARYLLKACIPVAFILLFLQGISLSFSSIQTILRNSEK